MIIKTVRELKNMLNTINDEKMLDKEILYCYEEDGGGYVCRGAWFDWQDDYMFGYSPAITLCRTLTDLREHEGRIPWTEFDEEEED